MPPPVFLSYASADRDQAIHLADLLEAQGIAVWLDRKSIEGGTSWTDEIVEGIKGCPGGIGKTRLALAVAEAVADRFADGVRFVGLAGVADPDQVLPTLAQALEIQLSPRLPLAQVLANTLRDRQLLLVLDNFEQVIDAATAIADIVASCPQLKLLVTSREILRVADETEYPLPTLRLPATSEPLALTHLEDYEAVRLFVERAQAARPGFRLTQLNGATIVSICQRLDGLPLAIELAAARLRVLSPEALLARLEHRLPLLTGGARDAPARQQTLRNAIAWSFDLLTPSEQQLFRRLGVFVGGWTVEAQEAVCSIVGARGQGSGVSDFDSLADLDSLIAKSLVRRSEGSDGEPRFLMLETIREFALEQLRDTGELDDARRRHATYLADFAKRCEEASFGPDDLAWYQRFSDERENVDAAIEWCLLRSGEDVDALVTGLSLASNLGFQYGGMNFGELRRWLERLLGSVDRYLDRVDPAIWGQALGWLGICFWYQGDRDVGAQYLRDGIRILSVTPPGPIRVFFKGLLQMDLGLRGEIEAAIQVGDATLELARRLADPWAIGWAFASQGDVAWARRDQAATTTAYEEALTWYEQSGSQYWRSVGRRWVGTAHLPRGNLPDADRLIRESLAICRQFHGPILYLGRLSELAGIAARRGHLERAARLAGWVNRRSGDVGIRLEPPDQAELDQAIASARAALAPPAFAAAWAEGEAMSQDDAIDYALSDEATSPSV
jgi:predicted ATPase